MKKITKITFYSLGIIALTKTTKYFLNKNKKNEYENNVQKDDCNSYLENENTYERKYIDITEYVIKDMNKEMTKCKK